MMRRTVVVGSVLVKISKKCVVVHSPLTRSSLASPWTCCCARFTDVGLTKLSSSSVSDVLGERLKEAETGERVVELLSVNSSTLTTSHLVAGLSSLIRVSRPGASPTEMVELDHLRVLCQHLLRKAHFLELDEIVLVLKNLSILKVSLNSVVMQTLLQILRVRINDLSLRQILTLDSVLRKPSNLPLVNALRVALPIVAQNHVEMQMDCDNPVLLAKLFWYGSLHKFNPKHLQRIADALSNLRENWKVSEASNILWGAAFLRSPRYILQFRPLILTAVELLIECLPEVPLNSLEPLLEKLYSVNLLSQSLLRAVSKRATSENWPVTHLHKLLSLLTTVGYVDLQLLETYAQNLKGVQEAQIPVYEVMTIFARCNYVPSNLNCLFNLLRKQSHQIGTSLTDPINIAQFALSLILLRKNSSEVAILLDRITPTGIQHLSSRSGITFLKDLALLKIFLKHEHWNEHLDAFLNLHWNNVIESIRELIRLREYPLYSSLMKEIGRQYMIYNGVVTKSGIFIDHLLVQCDTICSIDTKGYCNQLHFSEDIGISEKATRVALLVHTYENYAINVYHTTGKTALLVKALQQEGYVVSEICLNLWKELLEHERLPYLQHAISESLNSSKLVTNLT